MIGRVALGLLYVAFKQLPPGESPAAIEHSRYATAVEELRKAARARGGSAVIVAAPPDVRRLVDPWGDIGDGLRLMQATKSRFDPRAMLNPGRGPGGL
jgi:glycolate oxidase FAD binding subunit